MAKYSKKAQEKVKEAMEEMKEGKLTIGNSDKKVTSRKQAIASFRGSRSWGKST